MRRAADVATTFETASAAVATCDRRLAQIADIPALGEDLFDGVQIAALGWQEEEISALGSDDGAGRLALVAAEVSPADARALAPRGISARGYWLHNSAN